MPRYDINPCKVCGGKAKLVYRKPFTFICCKSKDCSNTCVSLIDSYEVMDSIEECAKIWNEQNPKPDSNN